MSEPAPAAPAAASEAAPSSPARRVGLVLVALGVAIDWMWRRDTTLASIDPLGKLGAYPAVATAIRWSVYCSAGWLILLTMARRSGVQQFIYFQF